jgi:hypothetical protein
MIISTEIWDEIDIYDLAEELFQTEGEAMELDTGRFLIIGSLIPADSRIWWDSTSESLLRACRSVDNLDLVRSAEACLMQGWSPESRAELARKLELGWIGFEQDLLTSDNPFDCSARTMVGSATALSRGAASASQDVPGRPTFFCLHGKRGPTYWFASASDLFDYCEECVSDQTEGIENGGQAARRLLRDKRSIKWDQQWREELVRELRRFSTITWIGSEADYFESSTALDQNAREVLGSSIQGTWTSAQRVHVAEESHQRSNPIGLEAEAITACTELTTSKNISFTALVINGYAYYLARELKEEEAAKVGLTWSGKHSVAYTSNKSDADRLAGATLVPPKSSMASPADPQDSSAPPIEISGGTASNRQVSVVINITKEEAAAAALQWSTKHGVGVALSESKALSAKAQIEGLRAEAL